MSIPETYTKAKPTGRKIEILVEADPEHVLVHADGRVMGATTLIIPEEEFPAMRAGYICAKCIEELDRAFPERCPVCGFEMRAEQTEYIAKAYVGNVRTGPSTTLSEEKLIMQEMREREARRLGIWTPRGGYV